MSSAKRKIWAEDTESKKKQKKKAATETERKDRLSGLPEELKLCILGCVDTKQVVQTMILSRSWLSLWTRIPVLKFDQFSFRNNQQRRFRELVRKVLNHRDPLVKLDTLKLRYYDGQDPECSAKILKSVFDYAFSHGVKHFKASVERLGGIGSWPVSLCYSLTSLKLETWYHHRNVSLFLGTRSHVLFKNLTVLHLNVAEITDVEPFSGLPVLERLTLSQCNFLIKSVRVHALRLSDLTIRCCIGVKCWELSTPRLRFLKYHENGLLKHDEGFPVLETVELDFNAYLHYFPEKKKRKFDNLMSLFSSLNNAKSLTLSFNTVFLLLCFSYELVTRSSPFRDLKDLTLACNYHNCEDLLSWIRNANWESFECVKAYLLQNSPHAEFRIVEFTMVELCKCFRFLNL